MKLLAVITWPEWRLRPANQRERRHWAVVKRMNAPPLPRRVGIMADGAEVKGPHKQRLVEVTRWGPRMLDEDGLYSSVKPCLDAIRCRKLNGHVVPGFLFDDSPRYCRLRVFQKKGGYGCEVRVYG